MADRAAGDALPDEIADRLAEQLESAIRRTLATACEQHDCRRNKCGCIEAVGYVRVDAGFWSPNNWPAMVTVVDDEIVELVGEFNQNSDLSKSWRRGVRSGQINQLNGFCRE